MNGDEQFEKRLSRQPVRPVPSAWREEILSATREAESYRHPLPARLAAPKRSAGGWWRELFWPHPAAWAALAGLWLIMLGAQFVSREVAPQDFVRHAPPSRQMRELLKQQGQLFAELVGPKENREADRPKPMPPQPRSSRREEYLSA